MRQSNNCPVPGHVESECEGEEVNAVDAVPRSAKKKKGVVRTKPTKTVKLATASGSPTRVGRDAMLECVREGRRCNAKFLDADVQRLLVLVSVVGDGKECGLFRASRI